MPKLSPTIRRHAAFLALVFVAAIARAEEPVHKVVRQNVRENGLVALYLRPKGEVAWPAIIVVGGSEGGIKSAEGLAYRFAERGWAALAIAYFGAEALPPALASIPLEYFGAGVTWLNRQPLVVTETLAVAGVSRGAELALLLAAHNPAFKRVVAWAPSHVVWGPVGAFKDASISAWTRGGRPLAFVTHAREPDYSVRPYRGTPDFLADLRQTALVEAAAIPVEKIQGAVLLLSGEDDQVWPSTLMARLALKRLAAANHPYRFEHVSFPDAGHLIGPGSDPGLIEAKHPTGVVMAFGGSRRGNQAAQEKGWAKVMEFLRADIRPNRVALVVPPP